jgi:hypothetical protein
MTLTIPSLTQFAPEFPGLVRVHGALCTRASGCWLTIGP